MNQSRSSLYEPITRDEMIIIFHEANAKFLSVNTDLIKVEAAERTLCGALMVAINSVIKKGFDRMKRYKDYFVDVEYNRNGRIVKTVINDDFKIVPINCDLILHSRGHHKWQDNLIAIEMKKNNRPETEKQNDRNRLIALTRLTDGAWSADGVTLPEHVCGYVLGIYYEVDIKNMIVNLEFYSEGDKFAEERIEI